MLILMDGNRLSMECLRNGHLYSEHPVFEGGVTLLVIYSTRELVTAIEGKIFPFTRETEIFFGEIKSDVFFLYSREFC